jgi:hypothetical protein
MYMSLHYKTHISLDNVFGADILVYIKIKAAYLPLGG